MCVAGEISCFVVSVIGLRLGKRTPLPSFWEVQHLGYDRGRYGGTGGSSQYGIDCMGLLEVEFCSCAFMMVVFL